MACSGQAPRTAGGCYHPVAFARLPRPCTEAARGTLRPRRKLAACLSRDAEIIDAASVIRTVADCVYVAVLSCFAAQVKAELRAEKESGTGPVIAPSNIVMQRGPRPQPVAVAQPSRGSSGYPGGHVAGQPMHMSMGYAGGLPVAQPVPVGGGHVAYGQQPMYAQPYGQQPMYAQPYGSGGGMPVAQGQPVYR